MRPHMVVLLDEHLDVNAIQVSRTSCRDGKFTLFFAAVLLLGGSVTAVPSPLEARDWLYSVCRPCSFDDQ